MHHDARFLWPSIWITVAALAIACGDDATDSDNDGSQDTRPQPADWDSATAPGSGGGASDTTASDTAASSSENADTADPYADPRDRCVERINELRASIDLPPLQAANDKGACADSQAASDAAANTAHGAFGRCDEFAQNECPGWGSIEQVLQGCIDSMWAEGPGEDYSQHGHYLNMTNTGYSHVVCGFYEGSDGVWAVMDFF